MTIVTIKWYKCQDSPGSACSMCIRGCLVAFKFSHGQHPPSKLIEVACLKLHHETKNVVCLKQNCKLEELVYEVCLLGFLWNWCFDPQKCQVTTDLARNRIKDFEPFNDITMDFPPLQKVIYRGPISWLFPGFFWGIWWTEIIQPHVYDMWHFSLGSGFFFFFFFFTTICEHLESTLNDNCFDSYFLCVGFKPLKWKTNGLDIQL